MKLLQKNKIKSNNLNAELTEMGVFSAAAGNQLPNQLHKRVLPALFHLRCPSLPKPSGPRTPVAAGSGEREMECTVGSASRQVRLYFPVVAQMVLPL